MRELFAAYDGDKDGWVDRNEFVDAQFIIAEAAGSTAEPQAIMRYFDDMNGARVRGRIGFTEFFQAQVLRLEAMEADEAMWPRLIRWCVQQIVLGRQRARRRALDEEIANLAAELRRLRQLRPRNPEAEKSLNDRLRELWRKRQRELAGKLILQGSVNCRGEKVDGAVVELLNAAAGERIATTKSNVKGAFEHQVEAQIGRAMLLEVRKEGFAATSKRMGGDGVRQVRFELLPLAVTGKFRAEAGQSGTADFRDVRSGAKFEVPIGEITKDGRAFTGNASFSAAVVDVASRDGVEAMPPLSGRTVAGAMVPMQSVGAVFTELRDAADGRLLRLQPDGSGIEVSLPSRAPLPLRPPSIWHFDARLGAWEQTMQPLAVDGSELPLPEPDGEARRPRPADAGTDSLRHVQSMLSNELQAGREAVDKQRKAAGQPKICTCGYQGKQAIMSIVREEYGLPLADPPKRVFAVTEQDVRGSVRLVLPYVTEAERRRSAESASRIAEVIVSHRLGELATTFGDVWEGGRPVKESKFYKREARRSLPAFRCAAAWLVDNVRATDTVTGERVEDVDPSAVKLAALEKLAAIFAKSSMEASPTPTLVELRQALFDCGGDVAEALLVVAYCQARRDEVAKVRRRLIARDAHMTAAYRSVEQALDECDGNVDAAAERLARDPGLALHAEKMRVREALYKSMPMANPSSKEVEKFIATAQQAKRQAAEEAQQRTATAERAAREVAEHKAKLAEAEGQKGKEAKEAAAKLAAELAELEQAAADMATEAEAAEAAAVVAADPMRAAELLAADPVLQEKSLKARRSWTETLRESGRTHQLNFQVRETGWDNIDAPQDWEPPADPAPAPPRRSEPIEFFLPDPPIVCPGQVSTMVLGAFDGGVEAARATACGVRYRGVDYTEQVQPDGTFSLVTLGGMQFELKTQRADGADGYAFGPFYAERPGRASHLGLLEPPRDGSLKWDDLISKIELVVPPLDFPRQGIMDPGSRFEEDDRTPTRLEWCTCWNEIDYGEEY